MGKEIVRSEERMKAQVELESKLKAEIGAMAVDIGRKNSDDFLRLTRDWGMYRPRQEDIEARTKAVEDLITPIRKQLEDLERATNEMEKCEGPTRA